MQNGLFLWAFGKCGSEESVECSIAIASRLAPTLDLQWTQHLYSTEIHCGSEPAPGGVPTMASAQTPRQADLAMMSWVSLAASSRIATNFDVGVWLPSPVLSSGTSGFTSG